MKSFFCFVPSLSAARSTVTLKRKDPTVEPLCHSSIAESSAKSSVSSSETKSSPPSQDLGEDGPPSEKIQKVKSEVKPPPRQ